MYGDTISAAVHLLSSEFTNFQRKKKKRTEVASEGRNGAKAGWQPM
jgi:hypothetical protein